MSEWTFRGWTFWIERDDIAGPQLHSRRGERVGAKEVDKRDALIAHVQSLEADLARANNFLAEALRERDHRGDLLDGIADALDIPVVNEDEDEESRWEEIEDRIAGERERQIALPESTK